jgi:hypothetical protein
MAMFLRPRPTPSSQFRDATGEDGAASVLRAEKFPEPNKVRELPLPTILTSGHVHFITRYGGPGSQPLVEQLEDPTGETESGQEARAEVHNHDKHNK